MNDFSDFITLFDGGVRLSVRAKPSIARTRAPRIVEVGEGRRAIEITVGAAPEDGKANKAILAQLAKELGLKKNQLSIKAGQTGRIKIIEITGDPQTLAPQIEKWMEKHVATEK